MNETLTAELGLRIKALRTDLKLSQAQLAERADLSQNHISQVERGLKGFSRETLAKVAQILNTTSAYLMGETDEPRIPSGMLVMSPTAKGSSLVEGDNNAIGAIAGKVHGDIYGSLRSTANTERCIIFEYGKGKDKMRLEFPASTPGDVIAQAIQAVQNGR
jgi:transcriptional regulator with XRE-family HTH domain